MEALANKQEILESWKVMYFVDDPNREPYLVHHDKGDSVTLCLLDYPDCEQDFYVPRDVVRPFPTIEEELMAKEEIWLKMEL